MYAIDMSNYLHFIIVMYIQIQYKWEKNNEYYNNKK
jgi:hypothetical protein